MARLVRGVVPDRDVADISGAVVGTPEYMAPELLFHGEQVGGSSHDGVAPRADAWFDRVTIANSYYGFTGFVLADFAAFASAAASFFSIAGVSCTRPITFPVIASTCTSSVPDFPGVFTSYE